MTRALIVGTTGQDGSYLAEFLAAKGYEVHGIKRRASSFNTERVDELFLAGKLHLHYGDLTDASNLIRLLQEIRPNEIYNLGAQSHVQVSFELPEYTAEVDALGTLRLLEAVRILGMEKTVRFYQAGSSEMFGDAPAPQSETTEFRPRSPYAAAKLYAHWTVRNYRDAYGIHASNGILFNHESPRRGETFVTRKITRAVGRIAAGLQEHVFLGNLDARRDWGFAGDYVEAMWLMLQQPRPDDFVIATGETRTVRAFAEIAFRLAGMNWSDHVRIDDRYCRPTEVDCLRGDASKAHRILGWRSRCGFEEMIADMVRHDMALARAEASAPVSHQIPIDDVCRAFAVAPAALR